MLSELLVQMGIIIIFGLTTGEIDQNTNAITLYETPVYLEVPCDRPMSNTGIGTPIKAENSTGIWKCSINIADPNFRITDKKDIYSFMY